MSGFKTHRNAGLVVACAATALNLYIYKETVGTLDTESIIKIILFSAPAAFIFALLPDIDIKSVSSKIVYLLVMLTLVGFYYLGYYKLGCSLSFLAMLPQLFKHRGFTHNIWVGGLAPIPAYFIFIHFGYEKYFLAYYIASFLGYMSHLIVDNFYIFGRK